MATRTIATKVYLDGEKEYKQAISEINSSMSVLRSEMALVAAEFAGNADSQEALTKKGEILTRQISAQKEKVAELEAALKDATAALGESDPRTKAWQVSLNKAKAELINLNRELDKNQDALAKASAGEDEATRKEKALADAASTLDKQMSILRSESRKLAETYHDNDDSVEALTEKHKLLEKQHENQQKRVNTLKEALQNAKKKYGETSDEVAKYQIELNNAEAELTKLDREMDENQKALDKSQKKFSLFSGEAQGLGDVLDKVGDKFGVKLPSEMQNTLNGIAKINPATVAAAGGFAALVVAIEKTEAKLQELALQSAAFADEILTLSNNTGLGTQALQEWAYAEELIDVSTDTVRSSMAKMIRVMGDAKDGSKAAMDMFSGLGVSILDTNGELRDSEAVFYDVIDALGQVENATERDARTMDIFGKSAMDLNSLIVQGSDTLRGYAAEAHEMGYVLSNEDLEALGAVDDAQQRLLKTQEAVSNQISAEYAPYMEKALTMSRDLLQEVGEALTESDVVESLGSILVSTTSLLKPLVELGKDILPVVSAGLQGIAGFMALIADAADIVAGILTWDLDRVGVAFGFGTSSGRSSHTQQAFGWGAAGADASGSYFNPETGMYEGNYYHNASGTDYFPGGMTRVGENGPETVFLPTGTVIANAQETRGSGGDIVYIDVHVDHIDDLENLIRIKNSARRKGRMKGSMA